MNESAAAPAARLASATATFLMIVQAAGWASAQAPESTDAALMALQAQDPEPLPTFEVTASDGHGIGPEELRDRVILLNFWATWCAPCRVEMPSLDRLQAELGGEAFDVVAVSVDRSGKPVVDRFYAEHALDHLSKYFDPRSKAADALGVLGLPTTILVDQAGREVGRLHGALEWDQPPVKAIIEHLIADGTAQIP